MRRWPILVIVALLAGACSKSGGENAAKPAAPSAQMIVLTVSGADTAAIHRRAVEVLPMTADGWDSVKIGMSEAAAKKALGGATVATSESYESECHTLSPIHGPKNLYVMTEAGKVVRVSEWDDAPLITDKGLGLGATEAQVRAAYGPSLVVQDADYDPAPAKNLIAWAVKGKSGIRYETDVHGRVRAIHAGGPAIFYAEDCE